MSATFLPNLLIDFFLIALPFIFISLENARQRQKTSFKSAAKELGFSLISGKALAKKTILLFAGLVCTAIALDFLLTAAAVNDTYRVAEAVAGMRLLPAFLAYLLVVRGIAEEVFFRGLLAKRLGVLLSSVFFAAMHVLYGSFAEVLGAFVLGLILAKAFQLNKNLYPNIFAHVAYNAVAIGLFYW